MCVRSSGVSASVKFLTLTASACFAAASSTAPPSLRHSSLLLFSRFHISASLPGRFLFSQFPCALAWPTTRRRARKSLTFTVLAFKFRTSAISSIENPSTSFKISISRSRSSNPSSNRSTRCLASSLSLMSGWSLPCSAELRTCLACSSLRSASYTSGRTFRFLSISQHSFTVILYSQVLNAARWSNRFSEKYALTNTCCATSSTSSRRLTIPPATANTRCWCRRTSSSNASLSSRCAREEKKLSQGAIEKRTGLLRCYISRVENGHTVPAIETLEKLARALEVPLYQLFYDGEEPPQLPNLPKRKSSDDIAWGSVGKDARFLNKLRRLLSKVEDGDRKLILYMAQKMANR